MTKDQDFLPLGEVALKLLSLPWLALSLGLHRKLPAVVTWPIESEGDW